MKWILRLFMTLFLGLTMEYAIAADPVAVLSEDRILLFNDYSTDGVWVHEGTTYIGIPNSYKALLMGTNHFHRTGWILRNCRAGCAGYLSGARTVPTRNPTAVPLAPNIASNLAANLQNTTSAMIESPVFTNGIGTIYFEAINELASYPTEITIEIATNMYSSVTGDKIGIGSFVSTNNYEYVWKTLDVTNLNAETESDFVRYARLLNYRQPIKMRIRRTGSIDYPQLEGAYAIIDNIRVSVPPTDVIISKTQVPFEPGYPNIGTNLTIRCYVSNVDETVPTTYRSVKIFYRWRYLNQVIGAWQSNTMSYVVGTGSGAGNGNANRYEVTLPSFSDRGDLAYYFKCDFGGTVYESPDYTEQNYSGYPSEELAPSYLLGGEMEREFSVRLRPYASQYGHLYAVVDQFAAPIEMFQSADNEWRAMVPLAGTGLTNLTWRFKATEWYVPGNESVSTGTLYWGVTSGDSGGRVPSGGACVATNAGYSGRLSVSVDSGSYLMLTLDTEQLQYFASRAEYQNFNSWTADAYLFSESNVQDPKHSDLNTFDQWTTNTDNVVMEAVNIPVSSTNVYSRTPFPTVNGWEVGSAAYVVERTLADGTINAPPGVSNFRNQALRLKGGSDALGLGYAHFSDLIELDGLKNVSFKCRLGLAEANTDIAYYRTGFTNQNYTVRAQVGALSTGRSPGPYSVSLIGYYQDMKTFYEYRVTQTNDMRDSVTGTIYDKFTRHELYKWVKGSPILISATTLQDATLTTITKLEMRFYNSNAGTTLIRCKYISTDRLTVSDSTLPIIQSGTFGVLSSECQSVFSEISLLRNDASAVAVESSSAPIDATTSALWYADDTRFVQRKDVIPFGIYSVVPPQKIGIYGVDTTFQSGVDAPAVGDSRWQLLKSITVSNFTYQTASTTINSAVSKFIMLQVVGGDADVVVDELNVASWHGKKSGTGDVNSSDWLVTEAWVVTNATSEANVVQLDHSRGNPYKIQAIRSLLMTNGLGQMEFDYRVIRAPAKLTVQYALEGDENAWCDVRSFDNTNVVGWTHASAYLGTNTVGYFRVLNARTGIFTNALVEINDAVVWDEPTVTNNSWRAYNAKISNADTNRVALDESKFCALNNSQTAEASPVQDQFEPFLESPVLSKGLGEISFYARAYTNNQPASLYLYASTNGWNAADNLWFEVSRFENITNTFYHQFTYQPVDGRAYNAIKLGKKTTDGTGRVCLDDVVSSEPIFPGFDIVNVRVLVRNEDGSYGERSQPFDGEDVDVEAKMDNIHLSPSNIVMHVSYYVGTNAWGIGNWPASQVVTRRMHAVTNDTTLYRTRMDNGGILGLPESEIGGILGQDSGQVVQYYVWATYLGETLLNVRQETFAHSDWAYTVDLNELYAQNGWSPYYIVFSPDQTVALPLITPSSGTIFSGYLTVTIACATEGALIYYTLDGSEPTIASTAYSGAFTLNQSCLVKAKAYKSGMADSQTATAAFTVTQTVANPVFSPVTGSVFANSIVITLTCSTEDAAIRYTLDGTVPTDGSALYYSKGIKVSRSCVVRSRAFKAGLLDSQVVEATYIKMTTLAEAVDVTNMVFTTGGNANWEGFSLTSAHDGVDAAQSGAITDNQSSWMETTVNGALTLAFWWKASCEDDPEGDNWDFVRLYVDGVEQCRLDGMTGWKYVVRTLGKGEHVVRWEYSKDESLSDGEDRVWVDQVSFTQWTPPSVTVTTPVPVPFVWLNQYPVLLVLGGDYETAAMADVDGDGYMAWQEYVAGSLPTNRDSFFKSMITMSNGLPWVTWTPDLGSARVYTVLGCTNLTDGVWGATNAGSRFFRTRVELP